MGETQGTSLACEPLEPSNSCPEESLPFVIAPALWSEFMLLWVGCADELILVKERQGNYKVKYKQRQD